MTDKAKPELDPVRRKSLEDGHYAAQIFRWDRVGRKLTERKRAELLAELELSFLWDDLTEIEREQAVKNVAADREWPGLFDKLAAESAEADRECEARLEETRVQIAKAADESAKQARKLAADRAQADEEDRKAGEAAEATRVKEQEAARKGLQQEREKLTATRDKLTATR